MKTRRFILALALGHCLVVACSNNDSRCNATNCQALLNCHAELAGAQVTQCAEAAAIAGLDAGVLTGLIQQSCIDACNANGNGALVQCVAQNFTQQSCQAIDLDGGNSLTTIETTCNTPTDGGVCGTTACTTCQTQCGTTFNTCVSGCADAGGTFNAGTCFPCAETCSQQSNQCFSKCLGS